MGINYYAVLGVTSDACDKDLRDAYRKLAMKWHPDKNPDNKAEAERMFKAIGEAYSILIDHDKRVVFDEHGEEGVKNGTSERGCVHGSLRPVLADVQ